MSNLSTYYVRRLVAYINAHDSANPNKPAEPHRDTFEASLHLLAAKECLENYFILTK